MKRTGFLLGLLLVMAFALVYITRPSTLHPDILPAHEPDAENGERLFHAGGCASCHASDADSVPPRLGGGLAMVTAFGVFHVPNISPDAVHGIGQWTTLDFINAMKHGVSPRGQHYYPAFPYASYTRMTIRDLVDLKSYLDTLPTEETANREHELKFPWNIQFGVGLWKSLNVKSKPVLTNLPGDQEVLRGRYLVEGPGHCGECHTPRNWAGGLDLARWLTGAPNLEGEGHVPGITPADLKSWSREDIAYYLQSGFTPDFDTVGGSMVKVQKNMAKLPMEDLRAIAAYLKANVELD